MLSSQNLLDCAWGSGDSNIDAGSCNGGSWEKAFQWIAREGVAEESCSPYLGADRNCLESNRLCTLCYANGTCLPVPGARRFHVADWGYLNATSRDPQERAAQLRTMRQEIFARGPIVCSMMTDDDVHGGDWHCYKGGIYRTPNKYTQSNHVISLVGYGRENETDFWIGRHSGGTYFGEEGFFRIEAGVNALNIESHCGWATVADATPPRDSAQVPCENGVEPHAQVLYA